MKSIAKSFAADDVQATISHIDRPHFIATLFGQKRKEGGVCKGHDNDFNYYD